ncbi:MAG: dephospho-CoA kinase [Myxococcales bacterium]|nr:dephospho-CoA kinase [Myxococcales bacterium]
MRIFGLTGGIASGKSTVARLLRDLGAPVVDADLLAREVVAKGSEALGEIVAAFGNEMLLTNGELDRKALGAMVFADEGARRRLEAITHPRIAGAGQEAMAALADAGEHVAIYEAALIVEKNLHQGMHGLIVVAIPESLQIQRLQERDGIDADEARARLAVQLPLENKLAAADHVIDNSGSKKQTTIQVEELWSQLGETQTTSK